MGDDILSSSVRTASYNIVFQIFVRVFTFCLNALILRFVGHDVLGICNVRLALLYSSILFLSREPFRRACLRKTDKETWEQTINLTWFALPSNIVWSCLFGYIWCSVFSQPNDEIVDQYQLSVWLMCFATIVDSFAETPYIVGQYFQFSKLRIVCDTTLIVCRSLFLLVAVISYPQFAIIAYALGTLLGSVTVASIYFGFFYFQIKTRRSPVLPFTFFAQLFPNLKHFVVPSELRLLVLNFFKQGVLKQLLTEGERYLMTIFDLLSFDEQGVYDLVSNLGSLAARFIFQPIEESAYLYFARTLQKRSTFTRHDRELPRNAALVLGNLFRLMLIVGLIMIAYGIPFSNTVLFLYGGENLSERGSGTTLLQANCAYILFIALNGVTEAFTFAVMSQDQLDKFNKKLVIFSAVFLVCSLVFTKMLGAVGFFVANALNMVLRIGQSVFIVQNSFSGCDVNPFQEWKPKNLVLLSFTVALILNLFTGFLSLGRFVRVSIGLVVFAINSIIVVFNDKKLLGFFTDMYKVKTA